MKKESVKILGIVLLSVMFISLIAGIVAAQEKNAIDTLKDALNGFFGTTNSTFLNTLFSPQILFGILIFLVIFAIVSSINIFGKKAWLTTGISIVVSILAAGFIDPSWYGPLINQYTAIGITISFLLPFVLLFFFIKQVAPLNKAFQTIIWVVYSVIIAVNAFLNMDKIGETPFAKLLYFALFILGIVMIVYSKKIFKWIFKEEQNTKIDKAASKAKKAAAAVNI
jgi:hypothetical protein